MMGFRIISFLTECLPEHPGFKRASLVQERSKHELEHLRKCLRDVALKIDECVCNKFVEDGDLFMDSLIASEMDKEDADDEKSLTKNSWSSPAQDKVTVFESWVNFDEFNKMEQQNSNNEKQEQERKLSESPTSETVGTTGSDSGDAGSNASHTSKSEGSKYIRRIAEMDEKMEGEEAFSDNDRVIREDVFEFDELSLIDDFSLMDESLKSYSSQPFTLLRKSVSLDFLKSIACEPVIFETDSDAADSWDNDDTDPKSRPFVPSSSGVAPTSDPARIAFRNLMNKLPHQSILQRDNKKEITEPTSDNTESSRPVSPTFSDIMEERDVLKISPLDDQSLDEVVDNEIQEFLDKKLGKLDEKLTSWNKKLGKLDRKLSKNSAQKSSLSSTSSRASASRASASRASMSRDASSYSSSSASAVTSTSIRHSRRDINLNASTSYDDSSYSSSSASGVYTDLLQRSDHKLKSSMSSDVSVQSASSASASHRIAREISRSRRKVRRQRSIESSDESSYSSSSTSSSRTDRKIDARRARHRERKRYSVSSDTSTSSVETPSSSYTSLASLRKQKGSDNSAFTSVRKTTQKRQGRKQRRDKSVASKEKGDWTSFENYSDNNYFVE